VSDQLALEWTDLAARLDFQHRAGPFGIDQELRALGGKLGVDLVGRDWEPPFSRQELRYIQLLFQEACDDWEVPTLTGYTHAEFRQALGQFLTAYPENN